MVGKRERDERILVPKTSSLAASASMTMSFAEIVSPLLYIKLNETELNERARKNRRDYHHNRKEVTGRRITTLDELGSIVIQLLDGNS